VGKRSLSKRLWSTRKVVQKARQIHQPNFFGLYETKEGFFAYTPRVLCHAGEMQKDFPGWHRQKEQRHAQHQTPTFQERKIWWCSVGVNIGHEMDGKNQFYNRPVLIVRKFTPHIFFGVPLTTKIKQNPY
jgi:hypothetical protein